MRCDAPARRRIPPSSASAPISQTTRKAFIAVTESCSQITARAAICHAGGYSAE